MKHKTRGWIWWNYGCFVIMKTMQLLCVCMKLYGQSYCWPVEIYIKLLIRWWLPFAVAHPFFCTSVLVRMLFCQCLAFITTFIQKVLWVLQLLLSFISLFQVWLDFEIELEDWMIFCWAKGRYFPVIFRNRGSCRYSFLCSFFFLIYALLSITWFLAVSSISDPGCTSGLNPFSERTFTQQEVNLFSIVFV